SPGDTCSSRENTSPGRMRQTGTHSCLETLPHVSGHSVLPVYGHFSGSLPPWHGSSVCHTNDCGSVSRQICVPVCRILPGDVFSLLLQVSPGDSRSDGLPVGHDHPVQGLRGRSVRG